jgi:hypothetical protein
MPRLPSANGRPTQRPCKTSSRSGIPTRDGPHRLRVGPPIRPLALGYDRALGRTIRERCGIRRRRSDRSGGCAAARRLGSSSARRTTHRRAAADRSHTPRGRRGPSTTPRHCPTCHASPTRSAASRPLHVAGRPSCRDTRRSRRGRRIADRSFRPGRRAPTQPRLAAGTRWLRCPTRRRRRQCNRQRQGQHARTRRCRTGSHPTTTRFRPAVAPRVSRLAPRP